MQSKVDVAAARSLIERCDLSFETGFDDLVGSHESGELVAVGARAGNVLKMLAVEPAYQGGPLLGEILTALVMRGMEAGLPSFFIFTKAEYITTFAALNFTLLASQGKAALLEYGNGLDKWLNSKRPLIRPGLNGAVVMNCNPFTRGHRYLVESAARQVDTLYLFVVREDRSAFPFDVRFRLVQEGVRDLGNVQVLDTSHYSVSAATFPTYFLKKDDPVAQIQMELDVSLFASQIAPFFDIKRRFVGTEPNCPLTQSYNLTMKRLLPLYGIELTEIERQQALQETISASLVRQILANGDLEQLHNFVPDGTLSFLLSKDGESVRKQLENKLKA
ncbi:MAG: [citrate (pro-3S)-lyase] ligase [Betaproteobacteria bacterium]